MENLILGMKDRIQRVNRHFSLVSIVKVMIAIMSDITTVVINDDLVSFQD